MLLKSHGVGSPFSQGVNMKIMGFDQTIVMDRQRSRWWIRQDHTCQNCGAILRLTGKDQVVVSEDQRTVSFECPNCGAVVAVRGRSQRIRPEPPTPPGPPNPPGPITPPPGPVVPPRSR